MEFAKNAIVRSTFSTKLDQDDSTDSIIKEVEENGICIIPGFWSIDDCNKLKDEIDYTIEHRRDELWKDDLGADYRIWGMDNVSKLASRFYKHSLLKKLRANYYGVDDKFLDGFAMANRITAMQGNLGSGGGWHRDIVNEKQLKTIMYLTDVEEEHGPFQYVLRTHKKDSVLKSIMDHNFDFNHNRFTEEQVEKVLNYNEYESRIFTAKAGTLIVVDTSGVHRGMPIQSGVRYALTNYCWISPLKGGNGMPKKVKKILIS